MDPINLVRFSNCSRTFREYETLFNDVQGAEDYPSGVEGVLKVEVIDQPSAQSKTKNATTIYSIKFSNYLKSEFFFF